MNNRKFSIIFSVRNKSLQIPYTLPTILEKYKNRDDIEILCMDDHSTDNSRQLIQTIINSYPSWENRFKIFESCRPVGNGYDIKQNRQINFLVEQASGDFVILQNCEIAYIDDIIQDLSIHCSDRHVVFATVYDCELPSINDDYLVICKLTKEQRTEVVSLLETYCNLDHVTYNSVLFREESKAAKIVFRNCACWVHYHDLTIDGKIHSYIEYSGLLRHGPWFFCGMIKKSDFVALGGYPDAREVDVAFGNIMAKNGFKFTFCNSLALHLRHDRK